MPNSYVNSTGLKKLFSLIKTGLAGKADTDHVHNAITTAGTGAAYTVTVPGVTALTAGLSFIINPHTASTATAPTLNLNGLGAKAIRRRLSLGTSTTVAGSSASWLAANKPVHVTYDGTYWIADNIPKTAATDIYGIVPTAKCDANGNDIAATYATKDELQSALPKVTTITLSANWYGDSSPYYQDISLSCVTENSMVDLQPTPEQLSEWQYSGFAFTTLSGDGTVRVYVAGGKPTSSITVQVRVQEVIVI